MPSVPTITSISPSRPAAATAPRPPGPRLPVACASSTTSRAPCMSASSTISASGATSPSIENTESVTITRRSPAVAAQAPVEVLHVAVAVHDDLRARQPAAVDDRRVVELVREDHIAATRQRADHAEVRQVARAEQQARLAALERRQALLQAAVDRHRPRHQARRARAHAPAHRRVRCRLAHARMIGQPQVVVRAQQQAPACRRAAPSAPVAR